MITKRQLTAQQLKDAYAAGERNFRDIEVLRESLYSGANLDGANLDGANLTRANLYGANLYGANLYGANLTRANLAGANLYGANLTRANLDGANLYVANLDGANLYGANLTRANLYGARHFLSARIPYMSSRGLGALFTGTLYRDRLVVYAGCFEGTPDEFRAQVAETHGDNIHAQLYLAQLAVFEASWRHWLTTLEPETVTETTANDDN